MKTPWYWEWPYPELILVAVFFVFCGILSWAGAS